MRILDGVEFVGELLKIAVVFPSGHFYDTPCVPNLAKYLARSGAEIHVFTATNRETPDGRLDGNRLKLHRFPFSLSTSKENVALLSIGFGFWLPTKLLFSGYDLVIACGIRGLFVVGIIAPLLHLRYAYNSLEIYSGARYERGLARWFKKAERAFNRRACLSIIQDSQRARLLAKVNQVDPQRIGLFPNAPYQYENEQGTQSGGSLRARFAISNTSKLVLYSGSIHAKWSGIGGILASAPDFPASYLLFLQARAAAHSSLKRDIEASCQAGKLIVSEKPLSVAEYDLLVQDAAIGLAWYESEEDNIRYVGLSSGKVAHFLRWGKPVILNRLPLFIEIFEKYGCGVLVDHAEEIPAAIERIEQDYDRYAQGARFAYSELFDMDKYAREIAEEIAKLRSL